MFDVARPFLLALAIGLLIGIERERAKADAPTVDPLGSRTFALLGILGAVAAHVTDHALAVVMAVFAGAIILAGYLRTKLSPEGKGVGVTTEVAAMATFVLGYLAKSDPWLTVMLAVLVLLLLALKPSIHAFAKAGIQPQEMTASLTFLVLAFVVLPLLPDRTVDPWNLINPARLWLLLVLFAGISFGGYIAVRMFGPQWGLPLAGIAGGLVSSTATTLSMSHKVRDAPGLVLPAAVAIVLANTASAAAQIGIAAVVFPDLVGPLVPVIGLPVAVGALGALGALYRLKHHGEVGRFDLGNPLSMKSALEFSVALAVIVVVVSIASRTFGAAATLVTAALGGSTNAHAVSVAVSNLASSGSLPMNDAALAILIAVLSNMTVKLALIAWVGGRRLALVVWPPLLGMMVSGVAGWLWLVYR